MNSEEIEIDGYTITICQDECAENPFENRYGDQPLLVHNGGRHGNSTAYNDCPETMGEIVDLLPDTFFSRGNRVALIKGFMNCTLREFAESVQNTGSVKETFVEQLEIQVGSRPSGRQTGKEWFEMAESLLKKAGIPCTYEQSNGYSQGDSVLILAVATPDWCKTVGCDVADRQEETWNACKLYGAWAWGDVYGYSKITAPDGTDIDASVWGYYGQDHEESGLLESARETIEYHKRKSSKEAQEAEYWLSRGMQTVGC